MTQATSHGCELVNRGLDTHGYARKKVNGKSIGLHRIKYIEKYGPIPHGIQIDHLCRNRNCINPDHLEAVTPKENLMRGKGACAANAVKTHCSKGHLLEKNFTLTKKGQRDCNTCRAAHNKKTAQRRKEERASK